MSRRAAPKANPEVHSTESTPVSRRIAPTQNDTAVRRTEVLA